MSKNVTTDNVLPLSVQLYDGDTSKFPRAEVLDPTFATVTGSPFSLTHTANGLYSNNSFTATSNGVYLATYIIYNDSSFTTESNAHSRVEEAFNVSGAVTVDNSAIAAAVWDTSIGSGAHDTSGTAGEILLRTTSITINAISNALAQPVIGYVQDTGTALGFTQDTGTAIGITND